jgi:ribosomal protein L37AE/L43A
MNRQIDIADFCGSDFALSPAEKKRLHGGKYKPTVKRGYAFTPGTGPKGETCKTCEHIFRNRMAKTYLKCAKAKYKWTGGAGSDILASSPACREWEAKKPE